MPIYAFRCEACGHRFDRLQKLSDADPRECPECGESTVKRQVTAPSFRLAGSGWYETDFKSDKDKQRNLAGKDEPVAKKEQSAPAGGAEKPNSAASKPAESSAAKPAPSASPAPPSGGTGSG